MTGYESCLLCEHRCAVDRTAGPAGACRAAAAPRIFCEVVEFGEEAEFVPAYAVSFSGCNFRCPFCITGGPSQDAGVGDAADPGALERRIRIGIEEGARSVFFLGGEPTIHLPFVLEVARRLRPSPVPLVLKTNLYSTPAALGAALDAFDAAVADYKFGNDRCAARLGACVGYTAVLRRNLRIVAARRQLIVRHLVMPGHVECCLAPVIEWTRRELPAARLSVRDHYVPAHRARRGRLGRTTTAAESEAARRLLEGVA